MTINTEAYIFVSLPFSRSTRSGTSSTVAREREGHNWSVDLAVFVLYGNLVRKSNIRARKRAKLKRWHRSRGLYWGMGCSGVCRLGSKIARLSRVLCELRNRRVGMRPGVETFIEVLVSTFWSADVFFVFGALEEEVLGMGGGVTSRS